MMFGKNIKYCIVRKGKNIETKTGLRDSCSILLISHRSQNRYYGDSSGFHVFRYRSTLRKLNFIRSIDLAIL